MSKDALSRNISWDVQQNMDSICEIAVEESFLGFYKPKEVLEVLCNTVGLHASKVKKHFSLHS